MGMSLWLVCVKACRGNELDDGMEVSDATSEQPEPAQRIPIEADFVYAYSTTPGLFLCTMIVFIKIVVVVVQQVAQLSQTDRAAGWVSNGQKWKTGTCLLYTSDAADE